MTCPDCKGSRIYFPLVGAAEPCRACGGTGLQPVLPSDVEHMMPAHRMAVASANLDLGEAGADAVLIDLGAAQSTVEVRGNVLKGEDRIRVEYTTGALPADLNIYDNEILPVNSDRWSRTSFRAELNGRGSSGSSDNFEINDRVFVSDTIGGPMLARVGSAARPCVSLDAAVELATRLDGRERAEPLPIVLLAGAHVLETDFDGTIEVRCPATLKGPEGRLADVGTLRYRGCAGQSIDASGLRVTRQLDVGDGVGSRAVTTWNAAGGAVVRADAELDHDYFNYSAAKTGRG